MTAPTVSVILIFLDEERYLPEAIDSVLAQTCPDWELLLCDDGSTDNSATIARQYAALDERIRCLEHPGRLNRGMSATRNLGLRHARGTYVALLDADDVWLPQKLSEQVALAERHPSAGMVCGAPQYWRSWSADAVRLNEVEPIGAPQDTLVPSPWLLTLLYPLGAGSAPCPSDVLLRRTAITAVGGFEEHFHGDRQLYEDQGFLCKLYVHSSTYVSSRQWTRYRVRPDSCVATVVGSGRYDAVRRYFLNWAAGYLEHHPGADDHARAMLRRALGEYRWSARIERSARGLLGRRLGPREGVTSTASR